MKPIFRKVFTFCCFVIILLYVISCCSAYVAPQSFSYITIFAVSFPYLLVLILICFVISIFIKKRFAFFLLLIVLCGYRNITHSFGFNVNAKWQNKKPDSSLRIMTWNVEDFVDLRFGAPAHIQMLQLIGSYNPDILCLQEFSNVEHGKHRVSIRSKLDSMGYHYYFLSADQEYYPWPETQVIRGSAIFSKSPLTDTLITNIRKDGMNENFIAATIKFYNKYVTINTAHLASYSLYRDTAQNNKNDIYKITYDRKRAIQYKLREVEQLHQKQVAIIKNKLIKNAYPNIYCGDMNTTPCTYTYRYLKGDMQDAFIEKGFGFGSTFYKILPTLRIDFCFADNALKVNQCTVAQKKLSDHYPVITDVSWK